MDQGSGGARKQILGSLLTRGARVEHHQPWCRASLFEQVGQSLGLYQIRPAILANQGDHPLISPDVVVAMADEVQHMPTVGQQLLLSRLPAGLRQPTHLDQTLGDRRGQRLR